MLQIYDFDDVFQSFFAFNDVALVGLVDFRWFWVGVTDGKG